MSNLPTSFCIDIVAEKEHKRLQEFKDWINEGRKESDLNYCLFTNKYYGLTKHQNRAGFHMGFGELLTLDRFFELLDPKPYTISDLSNGVCAVVNDGDLKDLRKVLKAAFPKDYCVIDGVSDFYCKGKGDRWISCYKHDLPTQSVKLFLAELEKHEPITSINVGDEFMCIKDVVMDLDGEITYTKGRIYVCEYSDSITNNNDSKVHYWGCSDKRYHDVNRHFIRHQSKKEEVEEVSEATVNESKPTLSPIQIKLRCNASDFLYDYEESGNVQHLHDCIWMLQKLIETNTK